jgi:ribosomal protein L11 methyltransferase
VIQLTIRVDREHADIVLAELMTFAPGGLEEREAGAAIEYVLYGAAGELPDLGDVRAAVGGHLIDVSTADLPDDWGQDWRSFHKPVDVGDARLAARVAGTARPAGSRSRALRVRPPWEDALPGALDVVIDPGQAFGTGSHATTRLTLELLAELEPAGALADWGCGSGVLAIAAAKLGWTPVLACDVEPESVDATREGAAFNGVVVEVTRADVRQGGPYAPTVLANLVRPLLLEVAANLERLPDRLIISGLEGDEPDEVVPAFERLGLRETRRRQGNNWSAIELIHSRS